MFINGTKCGLSFIVTPKPRELSEKEIDAFGLRYYGGEEIKAAYEDTGNVWVSADTGGLPTYRFYNRGTNDLLVLKYLPDKDVWKKIELSSIKNLYNITWKMISSIEYQQYLKEKES
jgi:hypothetical protein